MKNHNHYLEQLRQVIGLRSYGQREPLVEYKKESFSLFENLLEKIRQDTIYLLLNGPRKVIVYLSKIIYFYRY